MKGKSKKANPAPVPFYAPTSPKPVLVFREEHEDLCSISSRLSPTFCVKTPLRGTSDLNKGEEMQRETENGAEVKKGLWESFPRRPIGDRTVRETLPRGSVEIATCSE